MRCYICDAALAEIQVNSDHGDFEPCPTCLTVIEDTLAGFTDKPAAGEDELGQDILLPSNVLKYHDNDDYA